MMSWFKRPAPEEDSDRFDPIFIPCKYRGLPWPVEKYKPSKKKKRRKVEYKLGIMELALMDAGVYPEQYEMR